MLRVPALIFSLSGIAGLGELLVHPLVEQVRRHLVVELVVEPGGQPPRLGAQRRVLRQQRRLGIGLLEVLEDRARIRQHQVVDLQHRHLPRRVHPQEVHPPLPGPLLDQLDLDLLLRQHQADLAAERRQRLMIETAHSGPFSCSMPYLSPQFCGDSSRVRSAAAVVRPAGEDRGGAVELLGQHHPHEQVRPDQLSERDRRGRRRCEGRGRARPRRRWRRRSRGCRHRPSGAASRRRPGESGSCPRSSSAASTAPFGTAAAISAASAAGPPPRRSSTSTTRAGPSPSGRPARSKRAR